jgi:prepilin-type N-terminal cleavage/methylation domain-containing protein
MKQLMNKGFGLVEVMIASAIITVGMLGLISSYSIYLKYAFANQGNVQAAYVAEEGLEAMTFIRDNGWANNILTLATSTNYYLVFSNGTWNTTTTEQLIDSTYLRTIQLADIERDSSGEMVTTGGTYDPNTKLVTVTVEYFQGQATTTRSMGTYLTNLNNN